MFVPGPGDDDKLGCARVRALGACCDDVGQRRVAAVGAKRSRTAGDAVAKTAERHRLTREHRGDPGIDDAMVGSGQAEPGHRTVQPCCVPRERERDPVNDLARLEHPVADGQAVVECGDHRIRRAHPLAVHPHLNLISALALALVAHLLAAPDLVAHVLVDLLRLLHGLTLVTVPPSQTPARSGERPSVPSPTTDERARASGVSKVV